MKPVVILVKPQLAENIGMVARAMKNCAISELRLVAPKQSHTEQIALRASSNSEEVVRVMEVSLIIFSCPEAGCYRCPIQKLKR